jgi:hypothetical protein
LVESQKIKLRRGFVVLAFSFDFGVENLTEEVRMAYLLSARGPARSNT